MKPIVRLTVFLCSLCVYASHVHADLTEDVRALLRDKSLAKAEVGVEIVRLSPQGSQPVFKHNSDIPLIPASNLKLVTTAAALEKMGADFEFKTLLVQRGNDLILVGDGDPTLGDVEWLKKAGWDVDTVFKSWAEGLKKLGITSIDNLYVDDSIFDQQFAHPNWPADQLHKRYVAQVGGVNLNANCVDFYLRPNAAGQRVTFGTIPTTSYINVTNECTSGGENAVWLSRVLGGNSIVLKGQTPRANADPVSVTINDPPLFAVTVLGETLKKSGIAIKGRIDRDTTVRTKIGEDASIKLLGTHNTKLIDVISRANKDSMNLYAEALCKRLGAAASSTGGRRWSGAPGSWENGTAAVRTYLTSSAKVSADEFTLDDGCGLSKKNAISANALAQVLAHEFESRERETWISTLAVGGVDGTLDRRFRDDLKGRVFAKSGYVNNVSCLSGYVKTKSGDYFAFSILMNGVTSGSAKTIQEKIVRAIDRNE
jgi:D-alanyl-D-alanine carboxypeptidase/D-alanyl-D-alanine-endopeptidase (penicillin-binding protein 4)